MFINKVLRAIASVNVRWIFVDDASLDDDWNSSGYGEDAADDKKQAVKPHPLLTIGIEHQEDCYIGSRSPDRNDEGLMKVDSRPKVFISPASDRFHNIYAH